MTWLEASKILDEQRALLAPGALELSALRKIGTEAGDVFLSVASQTQKCLEAAIRCFTRNGSWPHLGNDEVTVLVLRLDWGASMALLLGSASRGPSSRRFVPDLAPDVVEEDVLEWLLIDAWELHALPAIHDTVESLLGTQIDDVDG